MITELHLAAVATNSFQRCDMQSIYGVQRGILLGVQFDPHYLLMTTIYTVTAGISGTENLLTCCLMLHIFMMNTQLLISHIDHCL